ncbi:MAG: hypothetical protein JO035_16920, partial [Betaproteobacteria bacterium]|nr:hypothetical protein [Betaproteobacteria bacterium]
LFGAEFTWVYANEFGSRRDEELAKPKALPEAAPGRPEVQMHAALANTVAARIPPATSPSFLERHKPELAVSGAFLVGAALGKLLEHLPHRLRTR